MQQRFFPMLLGLALAGCASYDTPMDIAEATRLVSASSDPNRIWSGPTLSVSHSRKRFYGEDSLAFRLIAVQPILADSQPEYRLAIDANYGGDVRHYDQAKLENGVSYPTTHVLHEFLRCQFFSSMADSCLYRDRAEINFSAAELEAARQNGITLTLASAKEDYEKITIPANYVQGFLQAMAGIAAVN